MADRRVQLSKAVSHALRHQPSAYGLELDEAGWVSVEALLNGLRHKRRRWQRVRRTDLEDVVRHGSKQRFELDGERIRALYGHSVNGRIAHQVTELPPLLFHGTSPQAVDAILAQGLRPMRRQYVHLSVDRASAVAVGRRKSDRPAVLEVAAANAHAAGVAFRRGNEAVWLAEEIPPPFLRFLPQSE